MIIIHPCNAAYTCSNHRLYSVLKNVLQNVVIVIILNNYNRKHTSWTQEKTKTENSNNKKIKLKTMNVYAKQGKSIFALSNEPIGKYKKKREF
jgi:hypothetical protein